MRKLLTNAAAAVFLSGLAAPLAAQTATTPLATTDPLQCWWRTASAAVFVGRPFTMVLTCTVVETDTIKVVPDQSPLDPMVMQLTPFEVLAGTHHPDLRTADHRFFQYEYRLRIISEDLFGRDAKLPDVKLAYRIQTQSGGDAAIEGREQTYVLPAMSVRILSLVPADATDIRDAAAETFGDVGSRQARANLLRTVGGVLFALAAFTIVLAAARAIERLRKRGGAAERLVGDQTVLARLRRELGAIRRERAESGWTSALASRLAATLRIAGGFALSHANQISQIAATASLNGHEGHLLVRTGLTRRKQAVVSSSVTPLTISEERARLSAENGAAGGRREQFLEELERALGQLTLTQYGREAALDDMSLDGALETGFRAVRRLRIEYAWPARKLRTWTALGTWTH